LVGAITGKEDARSSVVGIGLLALAEAGFGGGTSDRNDHALKGPTAMTNGTAAHAAGGKRGGKDQVVLQ
jgi:hypothetical protein